MKGKTVITLGIVFLAATIIAAYPSISSKVIPVKTTLNEISLSPFTETATSEVDIEKASTTLVLKKEASKWNVASFSASPNKIDAFFAAVSGSNPETIVSKNPANLVDYELSSNLAITVTLKSTGGETKILVGKTGQEPGSFYAKKEGSSNVYLVKGNLQELLSTNASDWRDKSILSFKSEEVTSIVATGDPIFTTTKKNDTTWDWVGNGKQGSLDDHTVTSALTPVSTLEGSDFLTTEEQQTFDASPKGSVVMKDKNNKPIAQFSYLKHDSDYWVKAEGKQDSFKVYGYALDSLLKLNENVK